MKKRENSRFLRMVVRFYFKMLKVGNRGFIIAKKGVLLRGVTLGFVEIVMCRIQ